MSNAETLEKIRRISLAVALWSAAVFGVILVIEIWNNFEGLFDLYEGPTSLFKIMMTAWVVNSVSTGVLLTLLIASHVKKSE